MSLAIQLGGNQAEMYALLGFIETSLGHKEEAASSYRASLERNPDWPEFANEHAAETAGGRNTPRPGKPPAHFFFASQACLATNASRGDFLGTLAATEAATGRKAEAIRTLQKALALPQENNDPKHRAHSPGATEVLPGNQTLRPASPGGHGAANNGWRI